MSLHKRIIKRIRSTTRNFCSDSRFSLYYALLRVANELGGRLGMKALSLSARKKKDAWVKNYLEACLAPVMDCFGHDNFIGECVPNAPIWVCWWTGEETAPPLVQQCIQSIRIHSDNHPVYLITQDNYSTYLDIPSHILEKVHNNSMCLANFSDYLRFSLLAKYGGLWLDATIYCSSTISESIFTPPIFTCKGTLGNPLGYLSQYRWTSFCFGGYQANVMFRYMQAAFDVYWQTNMFAIDYLLVDYLIALGYENIPAIRELLDNVPLNNLHRDDLQAAMNAALPASAFEEIIHPDTVLYKLSWRETYAETTESGEPSVYGHFLDI